MAPRPGSAAALGASLALVEPWMPRVEALMCSVLAGAAGPHLGPVVLEHLETGGKRLRARLALAATAALGGEPADAVPWAAAAELFHNATLVHDDIQDGDRTRRGQPTVWVRHGVPQAINAGDLMLMAPFLAIATGPAATHAPLSVILARHGAAVVTGQAAELAMLRAQQTGVDAYLATAAGKTGGLFQMPIEGAALVAGLPAPRAAALAVACQPLGLLFQLQDDLIDLWGHKGREAPGNDLREGKISALVVAHLELHPEDRPWLLGVLTRPRDETPADLVDEVCRRFVEGGARRRVGEWLRELREQLRAAPALVGLPAMAAVAAELVAAILAPLADLDLGLD